MNIQVLNSVKQCITLAYRVIKTRYSGCHDKTHWLARINHFRVLNSAREEVILSAKEHATVCVGNKFVRDVTALTAVVISSLFLLNAPSVHAQEEYTQAANQLPVTIEQVRWKSEDQVRALLGEPKSIRGPIGTHASYELWSYEGFSVAFANNRAFHLFNENSLHKIQLEENR
jgi:hypothetical protein